MPQLPYRLSTWFKNNKLYSYTKYIYMRVSNNKNWVYSEKYEPCDELTLPIYTKIMLPFKKYCNNPYDIQNIYEILESSAFMISRRVMQFSQAKYYVFLKILA